MRHVEDDEVLRDGERVTVPMTIMDSKALADARADADRAYDEMCARVSRAWKGPQRIAADTECAAEPPLSEDARENAYLQYKKRLANAWRGWR